MKASLEVLKERWVSMRMTAVFLAGLALGLNCHCRGKAEERPGAESTAVADAPVFGGSLRVGLRGEPLTWNRLLATDETTHRITEQIHSALVRVNRLTQEVEPELAASWSFSDDSRELVFKLRPDVLFSDGTPFTADDVAFTFRALHDPAVASPLVETAQVDGEPLAPEVLDPLTVRFRLPRRTAVAERIFDSIPMLPRHRLEKSLEKGSFGAEYGVGAQEAGIVGLGAFVLQRYLPGQRVILRRNPHYWKYSEERERLPYLDSAIFEILPDANALMLRFRAGELDILSPLSPEDFQSLKERGRGDLRLLDLGPGTATERIWFNLNPESPTSEKEKSWFSEVRFRRAVSLAIDRQSIAQAVYLGLASPAAGPISPSNRKWWNEAIEPTPFDPQSAKELLAAAGFHWNADQALVSPSGDLVRFTLITNADNPYRIKTAQLIQEDLARIGIDMNLVPLEFGNVLARVTGSFDYQACLLAIKFTDPDPSAELPLWLSRSPLHVWHPSQTQPVTPWESRIDALMEEQMLATEYPARKALFDEMQGVVAEQLPVIDLVIPHTLIGSTSRVGNLKPTPFWDPLWNSDEVYLRP